MSRVLSTLAQTDDGTRALEVRFWRALRTLLTRLANADLFAEALGSLCNRECAVFWSESRVRDALVEHFGRAQWPPRGDAIPERDEMLDLIEFFYLHASKPTHWEHHFACSDQHADRLDQAAGRYNYGRDQPPAPAISPAVQASGRTSAARAFTDTRQPRS